LNVKPPTTLCFLCRLEPNLTAKIERHNAQKNCELSTLFNTV